MMDEAVKPAAGDKHEKHYTAVIYFHGMGSQRRLEETSRLIDSIDQYLAECQRSGAPHGYVARIRPRLEAGRLHPDRTFTHIRTDYWTSATQDRAETKLVRFYEVYWAPVMAGQKSAIGVVKWMLRQIARPFGTLRSPWRERQRLRRASLASLYEDAAKIDGVEPKDYSAMVRLYDLFEGPDAQFAHPRGRFADFLSFLREQNATRPDAAQRLERLARAWLTHYRKTELRNLFLLFTLALALLLTGGAAVALMLVILQRLTAILAGTPLAEFAAQAPATWQTAIGFVVSLASFVGLTRFVTDYLGDVEAWATYEETDEKYERRAKVIDIGKDVLEQVLGDEHCDRAVLVSHSLGTTIAHDTLFSILRDNRARKPEDPIVGPVPLRKIEHFVTLGSPIDKIEYFFESYRSPFHRYRRITENLRGDIGTEPFCRNRKPFIHWINFWDDGDPVSGSLQSPSGHEGFVQRVDNVHVANLPFPNPAASHSAYFRNREVIGKLSAIIFERAWSFRTLPSHEGRDRDWSSVFIGPAIDPPGRRRFWLLLALSIPWAVLAALGVQFAAPAAAAWAWGVPALAALLLALGYLANLKQPASRLAQTASSGGETGASENAMTARTVTQSPADALHSP